MAQHVIVGSGAIGSAVANLLVDAGHTVRIVTRRGSGPDREGVERVAADAADAERLTALTRGAVALYNCANPPYDKWLTAWPPLASSLLTAAERTGAGLVTMGNLYGYGPVDGPMTEETPLAATGPKGRMRNRMWADMLAAQDAGRARVTEARASDFYGPGPVGTSHLGQYFMPRLLAGKRPLVMQADLDAPHSFTYVPDVARTLVTLAGDDRAWGRAWHVPTAPAVSLREIAARMATIAGVRDRGVLVPPHLLVRALGLAVPFVRELEEVRYQFTRPFVLDSRAAQETFGLAPTPLDGGPGRARAAGGAQRSRPGGEWRCERLTRPQTVARRSTTMPTDQPDLIVERYLRRLGGGRPDPAALTFYASLDQMRSVDPLVADRVVAELVDQRSNIKLIASENYASLAVQQAMGNLLTDKYAEGFGGAPVLRGLRQRRRHRVARLRSWRRRCSAPSTPTCSRTRASTRTWSRSSRSSPPASRTASSSGSMCKNVSALSDEQFAALRTELHDQRLLGMDYYSGGHLTHGYRFNISSRSCSTPAATPWTGRPACSTSTRCARQLHEVKPADPAGRLQRVPAQDRLREDARARRRGRRDVHGRHGAFRRAGRRQGVHRRLRPGAARARRHQHHAQDPARPARWHRPVRRPSTPRPSTRAARRCWAARCRT